eukprot:scaffold16256_cov75-Phaeocystis_antarctica.AAC.3
MKTATSRLCSATLLIEPLRATSRAARASATASISTSGHNPLKARRVVSPPAHFQSGKMKRPRSKPSGVSTDIQSLSPLGMVLSEARLRRGLTWPEVQGAAQRLQAVLACLRPEQAGVACRARQGKQGELLESIALNVAALFAGGRIGVVVAIGLGAPLAARPIVAGGALCAVNATEARGYVLRSVACLDVGGAVLTERKSNTRGQRQSEGPRFECVAISHRETPSRWRQGHAGESEADACAVHVATARCADDAVSRCSSVVKRPCRAAAVVVVHGTSALGGEANLAGFANDRPLRAVLSNLARLAAEGVRRVVARSTDSALATAQERLDAFTVGSPRSSQALNNHKGRDRGVLDGDHVSDDGARRICDIHAQLGRECRDALALPNDFGTGDIHGRLVSNGDDELQCI